jgi:hypothetical protein
MAWGQARVTVTFESDEAEHQTLWGRERKTSHIGYLFKDRAGGYVNTDGQSRNGTYYVIGYVPPMAWALWKADPEEFKRALLDGAEEYLKVRNLQVSVKDPEEED